MNTRSSSYSLLSSTLGLTTSSIEAYQDSQTLCLTKSGLGIALFSRSEFVVFSSPGAQASFMITSLDFYYQKVTQLLDYDVHPKLRIQSPVISFRVSWGGGSSHHAKVTFLCHTWKPWIIGCISFLSWFLLLLETGFPHSGKCTFSVSGLNGCPYLL